MAIMSVRLSLDVLSAVRLVEEGVCCDVHDALAGVVGVGPGRLQVLCGLVGCATVVAAACLQWEEDCELPGTLHLFYNKGLTRRLENVGQSLWM